MQICSCCGNKNPEGGKRFVRVDVITRILLMRIGDSLPGEDSRSRMKAILETIFQ
jgi:hypothetical protein